MFIVPRKRDVKPTDEKVLAKKLEGMESKAKAELEKCPLTKQELMQNLTDSEAQMMGQIPQPMLDKILGKLGIQ